MPLNTNIAMSGQPVQIANPMEMYGKMASIQNAQNQNALAQYQLGAAQRTEKSQNVLADAYAQATDPATGKIDYNKLTSLVAAGGGGAQLPGIQKSRLEYETAQTTQQKAQSDLLDAKLKQSRGFLDTIDPASPDAPQRYLNWHEANHRDPIVGAALAARGITADQSRSQIMAAITEGPQALADLINKSKLGTEKFMEVNKPITVSPGASVFQGGKSVFTAPAAAPTPLNVSRLIKERDALLPGDPNIAIYNDAIRKETQFAPRPITNVNMPPQEKAEQGERGKMLVGEYSDISKAAKLAAKILPSIDANLSILDKGFSTGFGTETVAAGAKVLAALGVADADKFATNAQVFQAKATEAVLQKQLEQKGPQTESDAQRIDQIGAQLGKTTAGNRFVLTTAKEQLKRDMEQRNFYDKWWQKNKTYDGAEDAWFSGEGGKSLFDRPALKAYVKSAEAAAAPPAANRPSLDNIFAPKK
jgi:hypothetical protein